ncbi:protein D2-like [Amphibalanus amphitrite]|uniref:protein D2-like n=1 Tax=Amphibalanus amphitrite TaxID=1232801 RepID=UPI001C906B6A|nr:protein D2-like [Amphibalanus amphitrite]
MWLLGVGRFQPQLSFMYLPPPQEDLELREAFKRHEVIPDVIDEAPRSRLTVEYCTGVSAQLGNQVTPAEIRCQPHVTWPAEPGSLYTLAMTDPDVPNRNNRTEGEVRHWLVVNIPTNQLKAGDVISDYIGSGAPEGSGVHRYIFLLYRQPGLISADPELRQTFRQARGRFGWKVSQFARENGLGRPVAGNFFRAEYDDYVPVLYAQLNDFP